MVEQVMFRGTQTVKVDGKGRMVVPTRYREVLSAGEGGIVVTGHPDGFLLLMFRDNYLELERDISERPDDGLRALYYKQTLIGKADDTARLDNQGRLLLAPDLREHARIDAEVAVVGMRTHLRLWGKAQLDKVTEEMRDAADTTGVLPDGWDGFTI